MRLEQLFNYYKSDKGSIWSDGSTGGHQYDYESLVPRNTEVLLEIGIGTNLKCPAGVEHDSKIPAHGFNGSCGSIWAWLEWLEKGKVFGFDLGTPDLNLYSKKNFFFLEGDQGVKEDLEKLKNFIPMCDVIIDDGSHFSHHQLLSLNILWDKLKVGGIYVIEDTALKWGNAPHPSDILPNDERFLKFIGKNNQGIVLKKN